MANYSNENHSSREVLLGNNQFRTGILTVPANTTISEGEMLQTASTKFTRYTGASGEVGVCVMVGTEVNSTSSAVDVPVRVCIAGLVDQKLIKVGASAATAVQADVLRNYGIIPVVVNQVGQLDNS